MYQLRRVTQWSVEGRPDDGKERHWLEADLNVNDLVYMLGLAPGTQIISMKMDRDHENVTFTLEEPPCLDSDDASSGGSASA